MHLNRYLLWMGILPPPIGFLMPQATPQITERTYYPILMKYIQEIGGSGVQEVSFNSVPDIVFKLNDKSWILSVKIGQDLTTIKSAFLQYLRHKEESNIPFGMLLLLPNEARDVIAEEGIIESAINQFKPVVLIDAGDVKEELRDKTFPEVVNYIDSVISDKVFRKEKGYYPLSLVISLLQLQVKEMMDDLDIGETEILKIITDRDLLAGLGHLKNNQIEDVGKFLASYLLMSQILFLRLLSVAIPDIVDIRPKQISHHKLRQMFKKVLDINYEPIFGIDVLDAIPEKFLCDTFGLIWGLEVERVRYDLPGRIFHELMPSDIRKMLAAFYTRPLAAELLAKLTIDSSDSLVLDPACGSGTILVAAYRRKKELFDIEGKVGNPHKRFVEEEIYGSDIMPFAVHLSSANLSAMQAETTIERTLIIQGDSLDLVSGELYEGGVQQFGMFHEVPTATTTGGEKFDVSLDKVNTILMNPPFTKVERGISKFVNMDRFVGMVGGSVGLWGHFIALAHAFIDNGGKLGAVIPINILRGTESKQVRAILFSEWTPLFIIKSTMNYGFSEWAEYRDVLFIAQKNKPPAGHKIKFCFVKKDLTYLTQTDVEKIVDIATSKDRTRSKLLDIESVPIEDVWTRMENLMWFCGGIDFGYRDLQLDLINKSKKNFSSFPSNYFKEGFRPVPKGVSGFLFMTRASDESRIRYAFLRFIKETSKTVFAQTPLGAEIKIEKEALLPTLRTPVGLGEMDITNKWDYIAHKPPKKINNIISATGFTKPANFAWNEYWDGVKGDLNNIGTNIVICRRINPFSPNTKLIAFYSDKMIYPSNQMNVITEKNQQRAKALCIVLNSIVFLSQFFLLKEESTGRYIDIRFYDLYAMDLYPRKAVLKKLEGLFDKFRGRTFKSLREQFDINFDSRYDEYWEKHENPHSQEHLWSVLDKPIEPTKNRLSLDLEICSILGIPIDEDDLTKLYDAIVQEMIIIRGLKRD